jgi:hypothetical protein
MNALTLHAVYTSPGHSCFCPAILPNVLSIDRLTLVKSPIFPAIGVCDSLSVAACYLSVRVHD